MTEYPYGSVFKVTRQDTEESIRNAFAHMQGSGFNTVVIWPPAYYWEPKGENYPFDTGMRILRIAQEQGLKVIMELAGQLSVCEYIPDFEMKEEYLPVDEFGHREWGQDSFGFLNYFHPEVKERISDFYRRAARAYKDFPALMGYDVFNETMYRSFDPYTMDAFRGWLKRKYGSIEKLNQVWERTYNDFSQIHYEHHKWMSIMPKADYRAFRKASVGMILKDWCDAVREADPDHMLIADNIHSQVSLRGDYLRPQDDYDLKATVGEIGMSFYPKGVGGPFPPAQRHQIFSGFADAARGDGFFVSEMQTHIQALYNPSTAVRPWELRQWCLEAYAHGAKGLIYWMWRPFTKGLQTLGRGLVDYRGSSTERLELAEELGQMIRQMGPCNPIKGKVGVVYDPMSEDFQYLYTEAYDVDQKFYLTEVYGAYKLLFDAGIPCDMIRLEEVFDYSAVLLPGHIVLSEEGARCLRRYINRGGLCITDGRFGLVDENATLYSSLPGGPAAELCGQQLLDSDYEGLSFPWETGIVDGFYGRDLMALTDGVSRANYSDGCPAVTEKTTGKGKYIGINGFLCYGYGKEENKGTLEFFTSLLAQEGITPICDNPHVKLRLVRAAGKLQAVAFNYSEACQQAVLTWQGRTYPMTLDARDAVIVPVEGDGC